MEGEESPECRDKMTEKEEFEALQREEVGGSVQRGGLHVACGRIGNAVEV